MAKLKSPSDAAKALTVPERLLLLCVASGIDFKHAKIRIASRKRGSDCNFYWGAAASTVTRGIVRF